MLHWLQLDFGCALGWCVRYMATVIQSTTFSGQNLEKIYNFHRQHVTALVWPTLGDCGKEPHAEEFEVSCQIIGLAHAAYHCQQA